VRVCCDGGWALYRQRKTGVAVFTAGRSVRRCGVCVVVYATQRLLYPGHNYPDASAPRGKHWVHPALPAFDEEEAEPPSPATALDTATATADPLRRRPQDTPEGKDTQADPRTLCILLLSLHSRRWAATQVTTRHNNQQQVGGLLSEKRCF
jgi:hypothetical protein